MSAIKHLAAAPDDSWTDTADLLLGPLVEGSDKSAIALILLAKCEWPTSSLAQNKRALNGRELLVSTYYTKQADVPASF